MSLWMRRWMGPILLTGVPICLFAWSSWAEPSTKPKSEPFNRAKEMTALINQGQLKLRDAAELAEKHVKGIALEVTCDVFPANAERAGKPDAPSKKDAAQRLVYQVSCFGQDKLQTIRVDGLQKRVLSDGEMDDEVPPSKP